MARSKTAEERTTEIINIAKHLKEFGITRNSCPSLEGFLAAGNRFIREGLSDAGSVALEGTKRVLHYKLVSTAGIESSSYLEYDERV